MANNVVLARRWARSLAFAVPAFLARQLGWKVGQMLYVNVESGALVIRPLEIPKAVMRNADGETDSTSAGRTQQNQGAGLARSAGDPHPPNSAGNGERDSALV